MKILIVGAGEQGYVLTWALAKNPAVTGILLADWEEEKAREVAQRVGGDKTKPERLDAGDVEAVAASAEGCALLLNAVLQELDLPLMEAALRARTHYLDVASRKPDSGVGYLRRVPRQRQDQTKGRAAAGGTGTRRAAGLRPGTQEERHRHSAA
jgi:saccharopine dehydrogenase-like NADP-dependent oxidoreductase